MFIADFKEAKASAAKPEIIAVDGILCDLVRNLSSSSANVNCLISPDGDPHFYQLKPRDREAIAASDIIFHNGFDLTPVVERLPSNIPTFATAELALPSLKSSKNSDIDPHVWHDPNNISLIVDTIQRNLENLLPDSELEGLRKRANESKSILSDLSDWMSTQVQTIPEQRRVIVTEHRALSHLASGFGMRELPLIDSFATRGEMRPSDLNRIKTEVKSSGTLAIFPEFIPSSKTLRRISRKANVPITSKPLFLDGLAPGLTTVETAISNLCLIVDTQGGDCDQKTAKNIASRWRANK